MRHLVRTPGSDFDAGTEPGDGAGPMRSGCLDLDGSGIMLNDEEFKEAPSSEKTPCCANTSIVFASLYLTSKARISHDLPQISAPHPPSLPTDAAVTL